MPRKRNRLAMKFSKQKRRSLRRPCRVESLEDRCVLATVLWDGGGDGASWQDPANWDSDLLPTPDDDVVIDVPGDATIDIFSSAGEPIVNSIQSEEFVRLRTTLTVNSPSAFSGGLGLSFGGIAGEGDVRLGSSSFLGGANIRGTGVLTIDAGATVVVGSLINTQSERVIENFGTLRVGSASSGSAAPRLGLTGVGDRLIVHPGGVLHFINAGVIAGEGRIVNRGTIQRTGDGRFEVSAEVVNEGSTELEGGRLQLSGGGSTTNSIDVESAATLQFIRDFSFAASTALTGAGRIEFSGGTHDFSEAQLLPEGTVTFTSGTVTIGNSLPTGVQVEQIRTNVTFNADQVLDSVDADFGRISGSGNLSFRGVSRLNQTSISGSGIVEVQAGAQLDVFSLGATINRQLENHGRMRVFAGLASTETIVNHPEGLFQLFHSDRSRGLSLAGFLNQGTFEKHGDNVTQGSFVNGLENSGEIRVLQGELFLGSFAPLIDAAGSYEIATGAEMDFSNPLVLLPGATLTGGGTVQGDVFNSGIVRPGDDMGRLHIGGNFTQTTGGRLEMQLGGSEPETEFDVLSIGGVAVLEGTLALELVVGFTPVLGSSFSLAEFASNDGQFSAFDLPNIAPLEFVTSRTGQSLIAEVRSQQGVGNRPTFLGTADPNRVVTIAANGTPLGTAITDETGRWQFTVPEPLTESSYEIVATSEAASRPRISLIDSLGIGDVTPPDLQGLELTNESLLFFPFGNDRDGILEETDVILSSQAARLALPLTGMVASSTIGQMHRLQDGRLLLDQETSDDPIPDYRLINEGLQSRFGLAGVLPFGIRRVELQNIQTDNGFSADFVAVGSFDEVELRREIPFPERVARELIREQLTSECKFDGSDDPDECVQIYSQSTVIVLDEDEGVNAALNGIPNVRTVEDLQAAEAAILYSSRFEELLDETGMRSLFQRDDEASQAFAEMFRLRDDAAQRVLESAVTRANSVEDPTRDDFQFVLATIKFASTAALLTLDIDPVQTIRDLTPAIEKEILRIQIDAISLDEITEAIDHGIIIATANDDDIVGTVRRTLEGFIDALVARVAVGDNDRTKLANTAVFLAQQLEDVTGGNNDPEYRPDDVIDRMRQHIGEGYEFDPENLLPQEPPPPIDPPQNDAVKVAILVGDLPLDADGRLTTEGVTGLLNEVPNGVTKLVPLQSEFEFSFAVDNGQLTPLNIPNLSLAFDDLQLGKSFEAAGFISLGSHGADGQFVQGTFAGGLDIKGDIAGFDTNLGVVINGTGANRGFFPDDDGRGGEIVAQAIASLDLTTPDDLPNFYMNVENAEATFGIRMHVDEGLGFTFEEFGLTRVTVGRFEAALGGTPPAPDAASPIPDDAFLTLVSRDVAVNLADTTQPLLRFGTMSAQLPTAPGDMKTLSADVNGFSLDVSESSLVPGFDEGFGFTFRSPGGMLNSLGLPSFIRVDSLGFRAGPTFFDESLALQNPEDILLDISGGIELPQPIPANATVEGMVIDVGALSRGATLLDAITIEDGVSVQIGPINFGGSFTFQGGASLEKIEYDLPGGDVAQSFFLQLDGLVDFPGILGIGANVAITELGPVAFGLNVNTEIPIGATGISIKRLGGRVVLNAPEIRAIDTPLDLLRESNDPGVVDFSDLAEPLTIDQLRASAKDLLEENARLGGGIETWFEPLLVALDVDLGINGDPTNTMLIEATIGARVDPGRNDNEPLDLKIFGLGSLTVMPDTPSELQVGDAGLLIDFQGEDTTVSAAFRMGGAGGEGPDIPAEILVGAQFLQRENLFELRIEGEVKVDGLTGKDETGRPRGLQAGGVLVIEPNVGMYGAIQVTVGINSPGDPLFLGGELFVRFNSDADPHELDPVIADALVPQLVEDGRAVIPAGFGLFARVEVGVGDLLDAAGTLEIDVNSTELIASADLAGKFFGDVMNIGIRGELTMENVNGTLEFRRLDVDAIFEVVLFPDFLEARADGNLLLTDTGLQNLSGSAEGVLFGLAFDRVSANVDPHRCLTLELQDGGFEIPLLGGACGVQAAEPTRMTVSNLSIEERDLDFTTNIEVQFDGTRQIVVPDGIAPEIELEYWVAALPDDTAVGLVASGDFRRLDRAQVTVETEFVANLPGGVLRAFRLPSTVSLPVEIFGDRQIERDETFSVYVQPVISPAIQHNIVRGDSFGQVTLQNDDAEIPPPADSVVFFDFDRLQLLPGPDGSTIPQWDFEGGPDKSRPALTFDVNRVSAISHSVEEVNPPTVNGLPREEGVSRAAFAETWLTRVANDNVDPDPISEIGGRDQPITLSGGNVVERREYFEFTIAPRITEVFGTRVGLRVDGIDFYDRADLGGTPWEVRYSLDNYQSVLASGSIHGETFGHNRVLFHYPAGQSANLPGDTDISFRIFGPRPVTSLSGDPLPWHIDNLALFGGQYKVAKTAISRGVITAGTKTSGGRTVIRIDKLGKRTTSREELRSRAAGIGIPKSRASNGFLSGGRVFFDANANNVADFLDLNGNGTQETFEPPEPVAETDAGGLFELLIPPEFDQDGNGVIDSSDGLLVSENGFDQGTGLGLSLRFRSPAGSLALTPLTTLISALITERGIEVQAAHDLVRDGLTVDGEHLRSTTDLFADDLIEQVNGREAAAFRDYVALVQMHDVVLLLAQGLDAGQGFLPEIGDEVVIAMADELAHEVTLSLTDSLALSRILESTANRLGRELSDAVRQAMVTVVVEASRAVELPESEDGLALLTRVKQIQRVVHTDVAQDLLAMVQGDLPIDQFLQQTTRESILEQAVEVPAGTVFPPSIEITHVAQPEPESGTAHFEFTVSLSAPSDLPVSVEFSTQGSTALSSEGDFTDVSGTILFSAGETSQTIRVPVLADDVAEVGEVFHVQLSNPQHALLSDLRGVGTILIPANATDLPSEIELGRPADVGVGETVTLQVALPGIVGGTVYWGDGFSEPVTIAPDENSSLVTAIHNYTSFGRFDISVVMYHTSGQVISGERTATVRSPGDANRDGKFDSLDFVQVFQAGKYETGDAAIWEEGDWNGDGAFDSADFVAAFTTGLYEVETWPSTGRLAAAVDWLFARDDSLQRAKAHLAL